MSLLEDLSCNLWVEASAGSGKTHSLVTRLSEALLQGHCCNSQVAAVTFTRKASAELRARLRQQLEQSLSGPCSAAARQALEQFEQIFVGTVHSFCAHLLRQYPVQAGLGPAFSELEDGQDALLQHKLLRHALDGPSGRQLLRLLQEFEAGPTHLHQALNWMVQHGELAYPAPPVEPPPLAPAWEALDGLRAGLDELVPSGEFEPGCGLLAQIQQLRRLLPLAQRESPRDLLRLLQAWEGEPEVLKRCWGSTRAEQSERLEPVLSLLSGFQRSQVGPVLAGWRAYLYAQVVGFLDPLRELCRNERIRRGTLNFSDLLWLTARLLRTHPEVRRELQSSLRLLCVDEFQDTDPLQAEIFFLLACDDPQQSDWTRARPAEGRLFLVGDPKQSIYRFRRADVDTYLKARQVLLSAGGRQVQLESSYRSTPPLCQWLNQAFAELLPEFHPLQAVRARDSALPVARLMQHAQRAREVSPQEAEQIAALIQQWVEEGYDYGDFLILTARKSELIHYQRALNRAQIPCQVSSEPVALSSKALSLVRLLQVLARPDDRISLIGVLRGPLFGHSDSELYRHFSQGGEAQVHSTLDMLQRLRGECAKLSAGAVLQRALEATGLEFRVDDEIRALMDSLTLCDRAGLSLADACDEILETRSIPVPPTSGAEAGVRVMNLHKAKGLEARVVFLAAPCSGLPLFVEHAVRGEQAAFCLRQGRRVLAHPPDWSEWEESELRQLQAEHRRLLYVAATRARDRLVVGLWSRNHRGLTRPWQDLAPFLQDCPELQPRQLRIPPCPPAAGLSAEQVEAYRQQRAQRLEVCHQPGWERCSVTATPVASGSPPVLKQLATPPDFTPGGLAWGDLLHRLLEHWAAQPHLDRAELRRLARWFAIDSPELQEHLELALDTLEKVRESEFWQRLLQAEQRLVEVPFARRLQRRWLFGVIDLALEQPQRGWDILDYKTDRKSLEELVAGYAPQIQQYVQSWREITGEPVDFAAIYGVREGRLSHDLSRPDRADDN